VPWALLRQFDDVEPVPRADGPPLRLLRSRIPDPHADGEAMPLTPHPHPSADPSTGDDVSDDALRRVMQDVPSGALALSGLTVGLLLLAWFLMYACVFLPRGSVG
jgi:hypothetical protein